MTKNAAAPATTAPATTKKSTAKVEASSVATPEVPAETNSTTVMTPVETAAQVSEVPAMTAAEATPAEKSAEQATAASDTTPAATNESPAAALPVEASAPATAPAAREPKKIDLTKQPIKEAIAKGKALIKEGKTKADAAMVIFEALKAEEKDVVIAAFVQGATLTEKGAVTYWYNCRRKAKKVAKLA